MNFAGKINTIGQKDFLSLFESYAVSLRDFTRKHNKITLVNRVNSFLPVLSQKVLDDSEFVFFIFSGEDRALYFLNDIRNLIFDVPVLYLPAAETDTPVKSIRKKDSANLVIRNETVSKIASGHKAIIVTYYEGFLQKVPGKRTIAEQSFTLTQGNTTSYDELFDFLERNGFKRTEFVYATGEFSVRGNIIDIYPFNHENPVRIVFDEDTVEQIKFFDISSQLTTGDPLPEISILPDIAGNEETEMIPVHEYLPQSNKTLIFAEDTPGLFETAEELAVENQIDINGLKKFIAGTKLIETGPRTLFKDSFVFETDVAPVLNYTKDLNLLISDLDNFSQNGFSIIFASSNHKQYERLLTILDENNLDINILFLNIPLSQGFTDKKNKIVLLTDPEIFNRSVRPYKPQVKKQRATKFLQDLSSLKPGDYVVHIDYGIGRFAGLEKVEKNGKIQEAVKIIYKDNDILYVSIHALHKISKYRGKDGQTPVIHKLGGKVWLKTKQKAKKKIKDIAKDLIALYAKRKAGKGFAFSADTFLQQELEASFIYQDTPDQQKATEDVKADMEKPVPMDRLICGDVGFGKTEVAIRAAFKAVVDGKQVAVLVPTTILALQHYKTFSERLANFPVTVDFISRFKSSKEQKETVKRLEEGKIDIIIGTHRLLSKDIKFKDLGLLILDEEQKFGVAAKEKLRQLKYNVDTLTLTATPIPRTLQFSLMGARDISIINTPPPNRLPVHTELITFDMEIIKEIVLYEINRGGQVFFINNRIQNIGEIKELFDKHMPGIRSVVAHGQMKPEQLEKIMVGFINGDYDVLISTSIVESGLDISKANTMIINNAHHFGLSDLHQLRGRVGRSNIKAFCYLITPPLTSLPNKTRQKLMALVEYSDLGSGFNIALQDLEIRGAGNLLGAEQSGFITDIGMETYQKILDEAITELKAEHKELFEQLEQDKNRKGQTKWSGDCKIETDLPAMLPSYYVESDSERIKLYYELNKVQTEEELSKFKEQLEDRFGKIPEETDILFDLIRIKQTAITYGMEKLTFKNSFLKIIFIENNEFYQSSHFEIILSSIQKFNMRLLPEKETKAAILKENINDFEEVKQYFDYLKKNLPE